MGTTRKIVAYGSIIDLASKEVHGVPLGDANLRVAIDIAIDGQALLPIPVREELKTVDDAVGSHVAWPKDLVIEYNDKVNIVRTFITYVSLFFFHYSLNLGSLCLTMADAEETSAWHGEGIIQEGCTS